MIAGHLRQVVCLVFGFGLAVGVARTAAAQAPGAAAPRPPARPPASTPILPAPPDTGRVLTFAELVRQVLATHPVAQQAQLARDQAAADVLIARGAFDPTLTGSLDQKTYNGTQYYRYVSAEAKVPLSYIGSDLKLSYERAVGARIAADRYTPRDGLFKLGIGVPLGQRIFADERRTTLAQARALVDVAEGDRRAALNKLLLSAAKDYAAWYAADRARAIARTGVALAEFRLVAVRARVLRGEVAPIDTVEAQLEVQRRTVTRYEADQQYVAAGLAVSSYLWDAGARPVDLAPDLVPTLRGLPVTPVDSASLLTWLQIAAARHPDVQKAEAKVDQAAAGRALARQAVIPLAELSLNSLSPQRDFTGLVTTDRLDRNYSLGGTIKTPLFFRKERGKLAQTNAKLDAQQLDAARVRRGVTLDVRQAANDLTTLAAVLAIQERALAQAELLLGGEQRRYAEGESSLLIVNLRERAVLDAALKRVDLEAKYVGARAALAVAVGDPQLIPGSGSDAVRCGQSLPPAVIQPPRAAPPAEEVGARALARVGAVRDAPARGGTRQRVQVDHAGHPDERQGERHTDERPAREPRGRRDVLPREPAHAALEQIGADKSHGVPVAGALGCPSPGCPSPGLRPARERDERGGERERVHPRRGRVVGPDLRLVRDVVDQVPERRHPEQRARDQPEQREPERIAPSHVRVLVGQHRRQLVWGERVHVGSALPQRPRDVDHGRPPPGRERRLGEPGDDADPLGWDAGAPGGRPEHVAQRRRHPVHRG